MRSHQPLPPGFTREPFTYGRARAAGVSAGRLRASDIQAPFRGVRHPSPNSLALHDRCAAFQVGMPRRAFFNSVTAARLMSLPLPLRLERDSRLHVATPSPGRGLAARGIVGHKVQTQSDELRVWNGLRISGPERTFCELTSILSLSELVAVGDFLIHWRTPMCSMDDLFAAAERYPGRRGAARLREAVGLLDARSESPQES
ncbi:MAG: hypothetical protein Q8M65_08955, partial [Rhodoglobus sp.]|nr:hypothetical protein [Rhodoglobus sp.]